MSKPLIFDNKNKKLLKQNNLSLEKQLQKIIEENLESIFGIKFLSSEYSFKDSIYGDGRIDTIGLDELNRPVVIEYKLNENKNIINQTLYYMNWLKEHKADFKLLVIQKLGVDWQKEIEWSPRGICIAELFNKYDNGAVNQMNVDISLIQYYVYGNNNEFIAFESINKYNEQKNISNTIQNNKINNYEHETYNYIYNNLDISTKQLVDDISYAILEIADDISENELKYYKAFKSIRNFASLVVQKSGKIKLYLNIDYNESTMSNYKNIKNVKNCGHWGTGNIEILVNNIDEFQSIIKFVKESYEIN